MGLGQNIWRINLYYSVLKNNLGPGTDHAKTLFEIERANHLAIDNVLSWNY